MFILDTLKKELIGQQIKQVSNNNGIPSRNLTGMIVNDVLEDRDEVTGEILYSVIGTLKNEPVSFGLTYQSSIDFVDYGPLDDNILVTLNGKKLNRDAWIFLDLEWADIVEAKSGSRTVLYKNEGTVIIEYSK